ncbi:MAG: HNH endonuclease [Alphaproteobacteria bacterium]|nr:HNH endonuclease [Alphaproteobacteria bacterium]
MKNGLWLQYRKQYCENVDGRLGFLCTSNILIEDQLEVDHIDTNKSNNDPSNLQTLCANCHRYKTYTDRRKSEVRYKSNENYQEFKPQIIE